jgi:hypothetical protein
MSKNLQNLISQYIKINATIARVNLHRDYYWNLFMKEGGYENHKEVEEAESVLSYFESLKLSLQTQYDVLKNKTSSNSNNLHYAITIGSPSKTNIEACLSLWNRFKGSADGKNFVSSHAYFEKGDNGYIHIHALIEKQHGFSMSTGKLRTRYGKHKGKQHNFDIKRLKGIEINKWENYIKKDSHKTWNKSVNNILSRVEE